MFYLLVVRVLLTNEKFVDAEFVEHYLASLDYYEFNCAWTQGSFLICGNLRGENNSVLRYDYCVSQSFC